jgi:hypothetical protein
MNPIDIYHQANDRAKRLLSLYDMVCNTRRRNVRADWAKRMKDLMHWPQKVDIVRVDGVNKKSILIFQKSIELDDDAFSHHILSELLRSSIVAGVSALDRYMHDIIVHHCISILSRKEEDIPMDMKKMQVSLLSVKRALHKKGGDSSSRPGFIIKKAIQDQLHREYTFQKPDDIVAATKMLGIKDYWGCVAKEMGDSESAKTIQDKLKEICLRRNQIVHEADLVRKIKGKQCTLQEISKKTALEWIEWLNRFVIATDKVIQKGV